MTGGAARTTVVLASASSGRLAVLRAAGIEPHVVVSGTDEDAVRAAHHGDEPSVIVAALAEAKADAVAAEHAQAMTDAVIIGADSMMLTGGALQGKPHTREVARQRWRAQAGRTATLLTGHCVLRVTGGAVTGRATATASTTVRIATPTDAELDAYLDSGEPLEVAGALTIDRLGGWFVDGIDGDPSCVIGLSLPTVRRLLADVGVRVTDLWTTPDQNVPVAPVDAARGATSPRAAASDRPAPHRAAPATTPLPPTTAGSA